MFIFVDSQVINDWRPDMSNKVAALSSRHDSALIEPFLLASRGPSMALLLMP